MAHDAKTRTAARAAYIYDMLPLTQVSTAHGVPLATLRNWKARALKAGDDWDKLRAAYTLQRNPQNLGGPSHLCADLTRARSILGYTPQFSLEEGMHITFETDPRLQPHAGNTQTYIA